MACRQVSEVYQLVRAVLKYLGRVDLCGLVSDRAMRYVDERHNYRSTLFFGPTNVGIHMVRVEYECGEISEALRLADDVDITQTVSFSPPTRRVRTRGPGSSTMTGGRCPRATISRYIRSTPSPCFSTKPRARNTSASAGWRAQRWVSTVSAVTPPHEPARDNAVGGAVGERHLGKAEAGAERVESGHRRQCCSGPVLPGARRQLLFRLFGEFVLGDGSVGGR